jgi:hypothetical protein
VLNKINGLPAHVLLVHVVVVIIPLAALFAIVGSVWPAARRKLGIITPITAFVGLVFVPPTTNAGEWLQEHVANTALVRKHVELGDGLLIWAGLLFVTTSVMWLLDFSKSRDWRVPPLLTSSLVRVVGGVLVCAVAAVAVVQVYRIGDSGAKAAWEGRLTGTTQGPS